MITDPLVFNFFTQPKQQVDHLMNHSKNLIIASHRMNQKKREEYFMNQNRNSIIFHNIIKIKILHNLKILDKILS